jgi:hypothetical protein
MLEKSLVKMNHSPRKRILTSLFLCATLALILYGIFQARNLLLGPQIKIFEPQNGATITEPIVRIRGTAKNITYLRLNNNQIYIDDLGFFDEKLIAHEGYTIMRLQAEDRFGRKVEKSIEVVYIPQKTESQPLASSTNNQI